MIRCPHCKSYAVENTGRILTSYPSYTVYKCNDCNQEFNICNNEEVPFIDLSKSEDVTDLLKFDFFEKILRSGEIPQVLNFYNKSYYFYRCLFSNYYYRNINDFNMNDFIHLHIDKELIAEADSLYEQLQDFYEKVKHEKY